jgi:hypothetical protein
MIVVEVGSNNYEASELRTESREYNKILQISPIFSNLHRIGGIKNTLIQICNQILVPCSPLVHMVIVDDATTNCDASTLRTIS